MKYPSVWNAVWEVDGEDYHCTFNESCDARNFLGAIKQHDGVSRLRLVRIDFVEQPCVIWDGDW